MALELEVFHVLYNRKKFHTSIYKKFNSEYSDRSIRDGIMYFDLPKMVFGTS
jgi:hypothetical protein